LNQEAVSTAMLEQAAMQKLKSKLQAATADMAATLALVLAATAVTQVLDLAEVPLVVLLVAAVTQAMLAH
jgi:hypothetical protein